MAKKFFDIIPPRERKSFLKGTKFVSKKGVEAQNPKNQEIEIIPEERQSGGQNKGAAAQPRKILAKSLAATLVLLVILGVAGYFSYAKTKIEVWPTAEFLNLTESVLININAGQIDFAGKIIPGKLFYDQKTGSKTFDATGSASGDKKASGVIRVYNEFSTASQSLVVGTRFVSSDGKLFKMTKKAAIPGGTQNKGKLTPGFIDAEVEAAETGESYNIGPSTFSIPGFAGTEKYTAFYGKSFGAMSGGFKGQVSQVVGSDLEKAENSLADELKRESRDFLKKTAPADFIVLDGLIGQEITKRNSSVQAGKESVNFNYSLDISSTAWAFKKGDIEIFAKDIINSNLKQGQKLQENSLAISYSFEQGNEELIKKDANQLALKISIKAKVYSDIDLGELKKAIAGKTFQEIKISSRDNLQIKEIKVVSSPILIKRVPENIKRIEAALILD